MSKVRGNEIAMIFQEPMTSLNPVLTIGSQIAEALMNNALQARCPSRTLGENATVKAFGKDAPSAPFHNAEEAARHNAQVRSPTRARQI